MLSRNGFRAFRGARSLTALLCAGIAAPAMAGLVGPAFSITATDALGNEATYTAEAEWDGAAQTWTFGESETIYLMDGATRVATLNPLATPGGGGSGTGSVYYADPIVNLNFSVQAGATSTVFRIASALLTFPTIPAPLAKGSASAAFSVTDVNGNGATLTGIGDPFGAQGGYLAQYNGLAGNLPFPAGTTFAELHNSVTALPFSTRTVSTNVPPAGLQNIGTALNDMSSLVSFTLSARDLASGTTSFFVIPEPASLALLAAGGLLLARRR